MWLLACGAPLVARAADPAGVSSALVVDPAALDPRTRNKLIVQLSRSAPASAWPSVRVKPGESLYQIVRRRYRYTPDESMALADRMVDLIQRQNGLDMQQYVIDSSRRVSVPVAPVLPDASARDAAFQLIDVASGKRTLVDLQDCAPPVTKCTANESLSSGRTWILAMSPERTQQLLDSLDPEARAEILRVGYVGAVDDWVRLVPLDVAPANDCPSLELDRYFKAPATQFSSEGKLYLLDVYGPAPANAPPGADRHGDRVEEVAKAVLGAMGHPELGAQIVRRSVVFDPHVPESVATLKALVKNPDLVRYILNGFDPADPLNVPAAYLQAIYGELLARPDTAVISASFYASSDRFKILGSTYYLGNSNAVLLAAVPNTTGQEIRSFLFDPQQSLYVGRLEYGGVLVGMLGPTLDPAGAWSTMDVGNGVTTLAPGFGYRGQVISPCDQGTSFATPAVASTLLVAKQWWKSQGLKLSAADIQRRLIVAGRVDKRYVGHYASAGPTDLALLLQGAAPVAIRADGSLATLRSMAGQVTFKKPTGATSRLDFMRGELSGLSLGEDDFVFEDGKRAWQRVVVVSASLTIDDGAGTPSQLDLPQLRAAYRRLQFP